MIIAHRERFGVSEYCVNSSLGRPISALAPGPILKVHVSFEEWQAGRKIEADAFLDIGADISMMSLRWIRACAQELDLDDRGTSAARSSEVPKIDYLFNVVENVSLDIEGIRLSLSDKRQLALGGQEQEDWDLAARLSGKQLPLMPGKEDVLIGRDVLTRHKLLVLTDGDSRNFSVLLPADKENRLRRKRVLSAFDPDEEVL